MAELHISLCEDENQSTGVWHNTRYTGSKSTTASQSSISNVNINVIGLSSCGG